MNENESSSDLRQRLLKSAWEPVDSEYAGKLADAQIVDGQWYAPKWGCDTLDHMLDELAARTPTNQPTKAK